MALVVARVFTHSNRPEVKMFRAGVVTVYVSDMDRAVKFYTEALGFTLKERYGNHWASIDGGPGLTIGLHPATAEVPAGRQGSIALGLYLSAPIDDAVKTLTSRGVRFTGPVISDSGMLSLAFFSDPDGNPLYLAEMAGTPAAKP
jgi:catechol 2,3-dioxygenase-like lactoylglutathione lyase family enzyme